MALDPVKNFAKVTVSTGYDSTATSITLNSGDGDKLPDPATDGAFNLVWWNATDYADPSDDPNVEIVRVTAKSGDTLTITRGQEGTSAADHNLSGKTYKMVLAITKKMIDDIESNKADKVSGATADNFASLDASGNLQDSGYSASDFARLAAANTFTANQTIFQTGVATSDTQYPSYRLQLVGSSWDSGSSAAVTKTFYFESIGMVDDSRLGVFNNSGTEVLTIKEGGNVGIGTTSPSEKLEVNGNVKASGAIIGSLSGILKASSGSVSGDAQLNDLGDASISSPSSGHYLRYDGTNWVNSSIQAADLPSHTHTKSDITDTPWAWSDVDKAGSSINDIADVSITTPSAGHYLRYDGTNWVNSSIQAGDLPSHSHAASDITSGQLGAAYGGTGLDTSASTGIPKISSGTWSVGANITDLGDVSISSPSDGQVLTYNSSTGKWENQDAAAGGGAWLDCNSGTNLISNTTNKTTIYSITIPGGTLGTNKAVRIRMIFQMQVSSTCNVTFYLKYGSYEGSDTLYSVTQGTECEGILDIWLMGAGSTGSQKGFWAAFAHDFNNPTNTTTLAFGKFDGVSFSADSTLDQTLTFSIQFATAASNNKFTRRAVIAEKIT